MTTAFEPIGMDLKAPATFLRCPKCLTEYDTRLLNYKDMIPKVLLDDLVPQTFEYTFGSTSKEIESAQAETKKLRDRVEILERSVTDKSSPADNELRTELGEIRKQIEGVDVQIEKAKQAFAGLLPDAADLAYLKVAKADATEIHNVLTKHIEEDHRRKTLDIARAADNRAWIAIIVSVVGVAVSFWRSANP